MEGVPDLRCGLLCTNGGGLTGAMPGLEVYSVFAAKHLWVEYGQASEFINLHLFSLEILVMGMRYYPHPPPLEGEPLSEEVILSLQGNNSGR